jgi:hypothetical protein
MQLIGTTTARPTVAPTRIGQPGRAVHRRLGLVALCLGLAACAPEGGSVTLSPPKGASVEHALQEFAIAVAAADTVDRFCRSYGLRKTFGNADQLSADYARKLREQGHTQAEIAAAASRLSRNGSSAKAVERLKAGGVRENDTASLCRYGREEIAKGSAIGQLLRSTK